MGTGAKVAIILGVLLVLFFFVPLVPYNNTSSSYFGAATTTVTAQMSPSFYMFGCGVVLNMQGTGSMFGVTVSQSQSVSGFYCSIGTSR